jgi:hypothetical protein
VLAVHMKNARQEMHGKAFAGGEIFRDRHGSKIYPTTPNLQ